MTSRLSELASAKEALDWLSKKLDGPTVENGTTPRLVAEHIYKQIEKGNIAHTALYGALLEIETAIAKVEGG